MKILVTGAAGFIGMHTSLRLLYEGYHVVGIDNLNSYYDLSLKYHRLAKLLPYSKFRFIELDLTDRDGISKLFAEGQFERVIHLAAQAGVRYSIEAPFEYVDSNLVVDS
jgi:UDP-glucuronate 4-epimerase